MGAGVGRHGMGRRHRGSRTSGSVHPALSQTSLNHFEGLVSPLQMEQIEKGEPFVFQGNLLGVRLMESLMTNLSGV